jgi:hypothetical protein
MFDRRVTHIIVALCTSFALIAFALYQRYRTVTVPTAAFFGAAAIICVMGELYGSLRHKACRSKSPLC